MLNNTNLPYSGRRTSRHKIQTCTDKPLKPIRVFSECIKVNMKLTTMVDNDNYHIEHEDKVWTGYVVVKTVIIN